MDENAFYPLILHAKAIDDPGDCEKRIANIETEIRFNKENTNFLNVILIEILHQIAKATQRKIVNKIGIEEYTKLKDQALEMIELKEVHNV